MLSRLVSVVGALGMLSGCVTLTTAQTARVLKPGQSGGHVGVATLQTKNETEDDVLKSTDTQRQKGIVAGMRYGLLDGFEVGARATTMGLGMIDLKLGLVQGGGPFEMAVGVGQGYAEFTATSKVEAVDEDAGLDPVVSETRYHMRITDVPLYLSLDLGAFALYAVPRYVYLHQESKGAIFGSASEEEEETEKSSSPSLAVTAGFMVGGSAGVFAEYTVIEGLDKEEDDGDDDAQTSGTSSSTTSNIAFGVYFGR